MEAKESQAAAAKLSKKKGTNQGGGTPTKASLAGTPSKRGGTSDQEEEPEPGKDCDHDEVEAPASKLRKKWFDPANVHKGEVAAKEHFTRIKQEPKLSKEAAAEVLRLHETLEMQQRNLMKNETTVKKRMDWVVAVLGQDSSQLNTVKASVSSKTKKSPCHKCHELFLISDVISDLESDLTKLEAKAQS